MKQYLLPEKGNFYKANLHMHCTVSDGIMTPEEVKKAYMDHGYSIVAYTDHEVIVPHNDLADENFLPITSYEVSVNKEGRNNTYHLNLYAKDKNNTRSRILDERYTGGNARKYLTEEMMKNRYERKYDIDTVNEMIRIANEDGFLVSYNHPVWSKQDFRDYYDLKGLWGVEVYNYSSYVVGYPDTITPIDDLVCRGENVIPLATDDAHAYFDCFGGFMMIKAEKLEYDAVLSAMEKGDLYASGGPLINELYIEDGIVHISTSPAANIMLYSYLRFAGMRRSDDGTPITSAEFDIKYLIENSPAFWAPGVTPYFRLAVTAPDGTLAYTRAYLIDELIKG